MSSATSGIRGLRRQAGPARPRRPGTGMLAAGLAIAAGLIASGVLVWQQAAVFSATTSNGPNSWALGAVALSDDDAGTALFSVTGLVPGSTGSNCLTVTYTGSTPTSVTLYASAADDPASAAQYLDLTIEQGTGGGFGSCTGFAASSTIYSGTLAAFTATATDYTSGVGVWTPSTSGSQVYKFSYALNASTPANTQAAVTAATFQWEAQF